MSTMASIRQHLDRHGLRHSRRSSDHRPRLGEALEPRAVLAATLQIAEFMAVNTANIVDEDGDHSAWIEIHNPSDTPMSLNGWYLTDSQAELPKWKFPDITVPPRASELVFASGKDRGNLGQVLHTSFRLQGDGEFLALVGPDRFTVVSAYAPTYPPQLPNVSYGISQIDGAIGYFSQATPHAGNIHPASVTAPRQLTINEIMVHPSNHQTAEEYIEVVNTGGTVLQLAGWGLRGTINLTFPTVSVSPGGHLVVVANPTQFRATYGKIAKIVGPWSGSLDDSSGTIELVDAQGQYIDRVSYANQGEWAQRELSDPDLGTAGWTWVTAANGSGSSLELVNGRLDHDTGQNWRPSTVARGTPGEPNSVRQLDSAPLILNVIQTPIVPTDEQNVVVNATIVDELASRVEVRLRWRLDGARNFAAIAMRDDGVGADLLAGDRVFTTTLPNQPNRTIVEYYLEARDVAQQVRAWPAPTIDQGQTTNALYQVLNDSATSAVNTPGAAPIIMEIMTSQERDRWRGMSSDSNGSVNASIVAITGGGIEQRHLVTVGYRGVGDRQQAPTGRQFSLPTDRPWLDAAALQIDPRAVANQVAGSLLLRLAQVPTPHVTAAELLSDGIHGLNQTASSHVETIDADFVRHHFPSDSKGSLYIGLIANDRLGDARGSGLTYNGQLASAYAGYQQPTSSAPGDLSEIIELTNVLNNSSDASYLAQVSSAINIDEWLRYFAMHSLLANAIDGLATGAVDGGHYGLYRGTADPRFQLISHDLYSLFSSVTQPLVPAAANPAIARLLMHPSLRPRFYQTMLDLITTVIEKPDLPGLLRTALAPLKDATLEANISRFLADRAAYVRQQIPTGISVQANRPAEDGRWEVGTVPLTLSGLVDYRANSVRVNGVLAAWSNDHRWQYQLSDTTQNLAPGLNRVVVEAMSGVDGTGDVVATIAFDVWRKTPLGHVVRGTLNRGATTWRAADGPYQLEGKVIVPADGQLTIEPGTSVYFAADAELHVEGTFHAEGTTSQRIRFTSIPGVPLVPHRPNGAVGLPNSQPRWKGIQFVNSTSNANRVAFADIEFAEDLRGSIGLVDSSLTVDHVSFSGSLLRRIYAVRSELIVQDSEFADSFSASEDPIVLKLEGTSEQIKFVGLPSNGGKQIVQRNRFGVQRGRNTVLDIDTPTATNDTLVEVRDNRFDGTSWEMVRVNGSAFIDGNTFSHVSKSFSVRDPGVAGAIASKLNGVAGTLYVSRNVFVDIDLAVNLRNQSTLIMEYNTITKVHGDGADASGNVHEASVVQFLGRESTASPGAGAYLAHNIFDQVPRVFSQIDSPSRQLSMLQFKQNLLSEELAGTAVGRRPTTLLSLGEDDLVGETSLSDPDHFDFRPARDSLANAPWLPSVIGATVEPRLWLTQATEQSHSDLKQVRFTVGGPGMVAYRYRVNGGAWSPVAPIGHGYAVVNTIRTAVFALTNLVPGTYTIEVIGQDAGGRWQGEPTRSATWTVTPTPGSIRLNEILVSDGGGASTSAGSIELYNPNGVFTNLRGMHLTNDLRKPNKFTFANDTLLAAGGFLLLRTSATSDDDRSLGFTLDRNGDSLYLLSATNEVIDEVTFGHQVDNQSIGRVGNDGHWTLNSPTLGQRNVPMLTAATTSLAINEIYASSNKQEEFVEIANRASITIDLGGLLLSNAGDSTDRRSVFPPLSFVAARSFLTMTAGNVDTPADYSPSLGFTLSTRQATLRLIDRDGVTIDAMSYGPQIAHYSFGRLATKERKWQYFNDPTPGFRSRVMDEGDFTRDGRMDSSDIEVLVARIQSGEAAVAEFDLTDDGRVDLLDATYLIESIMATTAGDANGDRRFDSADLVVVFQAGTYESGVAGDSVWSSGDWNFDGEFTSADLVKAFQSGAYVSASQFAAHSIDRRLTSLPVASRLAEAIESRTLQEIDELLADIDSIVSPTTNTEDATG